MELINTKNQYNFINDLYVNFINEFNKIKLSGDLVYKSNKLGEIDEIKEILSTTLKKFNKFYDDETKILESEIKKKEDEINIAKSQMRNKNKTVSKLSSSSISNSWANITKVDKEESNVVVNDYDLNDGFKMKAKIANHEVAPHVYLYSYSIMEPDDCHLYKGWWCWCEKINRFCISINNDVITAINTIIHPYNDNPVKFHEHKLCSKGKASEIDPKTTEFYVPKFFNEKSNDIRQLNNKMEFEPASNINYKNKFSYRIGSRDTLKEDLITIKPADARLYADMAGNHMLVLSVLIRDLKRKNVQYY